MLYQVHLSWVGFELTTLVVIGTDCIGSRKSNYYTITTMMAPSIIDGYMVISVQLKYIQVSSVFRTPGQSLIDLLVPLGMPQLHVPNTIRPQWPQH